MAEVRPLRALRYNLAALGSLTDVTAPPYDVIDAAERRALLARSPFNVVEIDLPEAPAGADPYAHADETIEEWILQGILVAEREPSMWALEQDYVGPDGRARTRRGVICRVRVSPYGAGTVRPHERTHPGPKEDRLRLTRATRHNLSPILALYSGDAWRHVAAATAEEPWGEATDADGTTHRVWRIADPGIHEAVTAELAAEELLIADGHHRYETAVAYADEVGGEGDHRYALMSLTALGDSGLTVFATHRLIADLDAARGEALATGLRERFEIEEVDRERADPAGVEGIGVFGYVDGESGTGARLRLRDPGELERLLPGRSPAYRRLDAAILEHLVLQGMLGLTEDDVAAKRGLGYASSTEGALEVLGHGYDAAFLLRPTPIDQVRDVAATGETMPPKSTYFFPKLLTGIAFNPLS
jgi:uncharacterized protein (DUF1015 family)